ncbi:MAG: iron ABC transporter permease [Clostridia bacterium]|nr:iron ABC transporter permease [Clostridia bacterium]NCC44180.1 iron ABC transporter permease [Clostridia bacterium]
MRLSIASPREKMKNNKKNKRYLIITICTLCIAFVIAILIGKYPITPAALRAGDGMAMRVFLHLRLPRAFVALFGGFGLGLAGFVYQTVFRNPLASPDIIGVSSGASVGAAFAILFFSSSVISTTLAAFTGGILAVLFSLALASFVPNKGGASIILAGIAVHSLAQTLLMLLKLIADPEKQLASIEYWIMGSLSGVTASNLPTVLLIVCLGSISIFFFYRQILLLSMDDAEARMLGLPVRKMRTFVLLLATLIVAAIISVTGLISFIGLLAPHIARLLMRHNKQSTLLMSGLLGSLILLAADIAAKGLSYVELPVSIFTSLIGAPFLIYLILSRRRDF